MKKTENNYLITKIIFKKKEILLTYSFNHGEKTISLAPSVYSDFYLYEGKELSKKELQELQKKNASATTLLLAYQLIAKKEYSVFLMKEKLKEKGIKDSLIQDVIQTLLEQNLINDQRYAEELYEVLNARNYGKNYIIRKLHDCGIDTNIITSFSFEQENEIEKMQTLLPTLLRKYDKENNQIKKDKIYREYLKYGFDNENIQYIISTISLSSESEEMRKCIKEYEKISGHYEKKYCGYEYKKRIIQTLMRKGFSYDIIKQVMERINDGTNEPNEMD